MKDNPTLGVFINSTHDNYESEILRGVHEVAAESGASVICFTSGAVRSRYHFESRRNVLYELVGQQTVDGLIVGGTLAHVASVQEVASFCKRYRPLPMVSVALALPDMPHIMVDSAGGVRQTVSHLIETHRRRKLAFLRGPRGQQEAEERLRAFHDTMNQHGLKVASTQILEGDYTHYSGRAAMQKVLAQGQGKVRFDALVSANDSMAIGAMEVLREAGIRVPEDIAVVGFDDTPEGRALSSPLTTVRQSARDQGREAARLLLLQLQGVEHPMRELAPATMVVRRSCGCFDYQPGLLPAKARPGEDGRAVLSSRRKQIVADVCASLAHVPAQRVEGYASAWLDALLADLEDFQGEEFVAAFERTQWDAIPLAVEMAAWNRALRIFRTHALACLEFSELRTRAQTMLNAAIRRASEVAEHIQEQLKTRIEQEAYVLRDLGEVMMTCADLRSLLDAMSLELPRIGARACFLSLFENPARPSERSRLILGYDSSGRIQLPADGVIFDSTDLVPARFRSRLASMNLVVEAIYSKETCLGFVLLDVESVYLSGSLRTLLSSALQGVLLYERNKAMEAR